MTTKAMTTDTRVMANQIRSSSDRLDDLEKMLNGVVQGANSSLNQLASMISSLQARVRAQEEITRALFDITGADAVNARLEVNRKADADAKAEREKAEIEMLLAQGRIVKAQTVTSKSLVVGSEKTKEGEVRYPGYSVGTVSVLVEALQTAFIGRTVGDVVELPDDAGSFEVKEVYDVVEQEPTSTTQA